MDYTKLLNVAGVPVELHAEAIASLNLAKKNIEGLNFKKMKTRLFKSGKIADMLNWEDERLVTKHPDLIDWDIAPMINVTAHGDNGPWEETPEGGRPQSNYWLNKDPESEEYKEAVKKNYWKKGTHPRSKESRKAWYKRNAGEGHAWRMGMDVNPNDSLEIWRGSEKNERVKAVRISGAWIIVASKKLIGSIHLNTRIGFEVDNVMGGLYAPQSWYPAPGYTLKGPVTWSVLPSREVLDLTPNLWEKDLISVNGENKTYMYFKK